MAAACGNPSWNASEFEKAVGLALSKLNVGGIRCLTVHQTRSVDCFLGGNDTFVTLPTGRGKSLIYQICPAVATELSALGHKFPKAPLMVVISPLNSLIKDQIISCERIGIKACKVEVENSTSLLEVCDYDILFASPEVLENPLVAKLLTRYCDRIIGIVIDESHCVVQWGTSDSCQSEKVPFREAYSRLGNLRSFVRAPFMCLTATASRKVRSKIIKLLHMTNTKHVKQSPDKKNITYLVKKVDELEETFQWLIDQLTRTWQIPKTIIYCRSLKDCGEIYTLFDEVKGGSSNCDMSIPVVAMYHSKTPDNIKELVLSSLLEVDGKCRVVIATSALGMGVNIPDVCSIIHYAPPSNVEEYIQEVGRGGRDGKRCDATLYFKPIHLSHCDDHMRKYVKNPEQVCRRVMLMTYFKEKINSPDLKHECCDVCQKSCQCTGCIKGSLNSASLVHVAESIDLAVGDVPALSRQVDDSDRQFLQQMLSEIKIEAGSSIFGTVGLSCGLDDEVIEAIANECQYIFSIDYIMANFPVFSKELAVEILKVVNEIFNDIAEVEFINSMDENIVNDFFFLDVEEQAVHSETDSDSM